MIDAAARPTLPGGEPFFVTGEARSGTTWLMLLLDACPGITCRGEDYFDELGHLLTQALNSYNAKFRREGHWASNTHSCRFVQDDIDPLLRHAVLRLLARDLPADTRRVGSKFRQLPLTLGRFTRALFPRSSVVHIVRDPRDVIISVFHFNRRNTPDKARRLEQTLADAVRRLLPIWTRTVTTLEGFGATHPDRYVRIRYEDLLTAPEEALGRVLSALGMPVDGTALSDAVEATRFARLRARPESLESRSILCLYARMAYRMWCTSGLSGQTLSGGRDRGQEDTGSFFRRGDAGGWEAAFDDESRTAFEALADRTVLDPLGYR